MPHYKLVPSGRSDSQVDEVVLSRDESGEVEHSLSVHEARSIPEKLLDTARNLAGKFGASVVETEAPEGSEESEAADDVQGGDSNQAVQQGSGSSLPPAGGTTPGGLSTPSSPTK